MWYIYIMENYKVIKKNEIMLFAATKTDLGMITLSDKDKSYRLYVQSKMNLFTNQKETHQRRKQTYSPYRKGEGEGIN